MKKKNLMSASIITIVALAAFMGYNAQSSETTMADLMLDENVEALTAGEGIPSCSASANCYDNVFNEKTFQYENSIVGSVSCNGTKSCCSGYEYVECDGVLSQCN